MTTVAARRALLPLALALVAGLSACGGDDEGGGGSLSKEEFISQGDTICREAEAALDELGEPASPEELSGFLSDARDIVQENRDRLDDLDAPEDGQEAKDALLAGIDQGLPVLDEAQEAADSGDIEGAVARLGDLDGLEDDPVVEEYGFQDCGDA